MTEIAIALLALALYFFVMIGFFYCLLRLVVLLVRRYW